MNVFAQNILIERPDSINYNTLYNIRRSLEDLRTNLDISRYRRWQSKELGIGWTPLRELPEELNPYAKDNIHILYKPEYLNRGGSGKGRPVSFMLYYYKTLGQLDGIRRITTAGFGNFIRTLAELLPFVAPDIIPEAYMGHALIKENKDLIDFLMASGVVLNGCNDNYCPTGDMERGKAITYAYVEEQVNPENTLFFDQHGIFKPFVGLLNAASYYFSLSSEISNQLDHATKLYYVNGEGTRGSLVGTSVGLKTRRSDTEVVGLRQNEEGHLFGLRSLSQLGRSDSLGQAEYLCDVIYEIRDKEAYSTMTKLWDFDIPSSPSGGSYIAGALRKAKALKSEKKEGIIVTLIFDSIDYYKTLLEIWVPRILRKSFNSDIFEVLRAKTAREREDHIKKLRNDEIKVF